MRLGDTCTIKDVEGIVTYLDFENNYAEITKKQNSICDTFTVNENDWFSIHYKDEHWRSHSGDIVSITKQNLDDQFISIKYLDGDDESIEKEIISQRVYNVVFPINAKDAPGKPGDLFEILSIDKESGIITCINNDDENAEEINVDVSKGISKNTTSSTSIIDFCDISYSSSSESDSDTEAESDSKKPNEQNYTMKDEIHENDKQLTKEQKRNFIGKSLRLMFEPANLSGNDIIKLIETIFKSIGKKFEPLNDWRNSIINQSKSIIPVLSDYVVHESENEFYEDDNAYFNFVQNEFKTLLIVDNIDSDAITYNSQAKDASYKDIVLNPSYKYNSTRPILNTSDRVKISKYIVNDTNFEFKNLPPSQQELADAVSQGIDIFKVFNINKYDIPVNYSKVIPAVRVAPPARIRTYRHKTKADHPYDILSININTRPSTEPVKKPPVGSYFKMNNNNINIDDTLVWDNSVIWPRRLALKMSKLNSEATSYLLNSYELGKETIPPGIKERESYLKSMLNEHSFTEKISEITKDWSRVRLRGTRRPMQARGPQASASPTVAAWIEAEANPDTEIENKIHILTSGEYVRDAIKGENPYYFIDIYSGNKFIPRHELLKLKIKNVTYTSESKDLYNCLLNEWGIEEENTTNIISIINKEFLGLKDAEYNYLDNKTYVSNVHAPPPTAPPSDIEDFFMRMGFINGFKTLLTVFSSKIQYKLGLTIDFEEYSIVSSKFFNSGEWVTYRTIYSYPNSFDKTTSLLAISKKLMRFEKNIEKLLSALNTLKKSNPKDKKIPTIYKRLKSELTKSKANYINKLWTLVGIYITSYLYSRIDIDDNAKIKIYSQFAEELSNTGVDPPLWAEDVSIFNEKKIKTFSNKLWEYSTITDKKYNYSYTKTITPRIINKRTRISELSLFNNIKPLEYEQPVLGVVQKRQALIGRVGHASQAHALGDRWALYNSGKIITDNGWYLITNTQDIPEEEQYNCLLNNICYIVLQSSVSQTNFKFPKKLKVLKEKGYDERMNTWLGEIYGIREYIRNIEFSNELIKTITSDVIAFRESLRRAVVPLPGRTAWTYLMQHLINEPPTSELSYTDYVNVLERIISYYIRNITKICGNNLVMNKSKVENIYATAAEDEASGFIDNKAGDKISQRLLKEERARSLGLFAKGLQKQFDIKTVQHSETVGPGAYESEWGQNFDNSDDHDGSFDD